MPAATRSWVTVGGAWSSGRVRRTTTTSRAAAALFAKTRTAHRDGTSGRAARGTGPGFAASVRNLSRTPQSQGYRRRAR
jgi:hypothetical protein